MTTSDEAEVEVRIRWRSRDAEHCERTVFPRLNFWRDLLPARLAETLPVSGGEWVSETFPAGELVEPYSTSRIHRIKAERFGRRRRGPKIRPHSGRFYPRDFAAGTAGIVSGDRRPMRILDCDADFLELDLNHPLADRALIVEARILKQSGTRAEYGGRCNDIVLDTLAGGAGLQAAPQNGATDFFSDRPFARMDETGDDHFYQEPRLVQHLDRTAISQITDIYRRVLTPGMKVLDLMSSWVSHLPDDVDDLDVTGLGMNMTELEQNLRLSERLVQDINNNTRLPFADNSLDLAVCTVSVEYLTRPLEVFREIGRVLKPGAAFVVTFSDRWFPTKAIRLWSELHPFERMGLVLEYFRAAECFTRPGTETLRGLPRPEGDRYAGELALSDPLFAVRGYA